MIGARAFIAMSWILTIFCAWASTASPADGKIKSLAESEIYGFFFYVDGNPSR